MCLFTLNHKKCSHPTSSSLSSCTCTEISSSYHTKCQWTSTEIKINTLLHSVQTELKVGIQYKELIKRLIFTLKEEIDLAIISAI